MVIHEREGVGGKVCSGCQEWQPLAHFSPRREHGVPTGDGFQNRCKKCRAAAELERYYANAEMIRAANRSQYQKRRDERLAKMRTYRVANREKVLAQKRKHWVTNKELINAKRRAAYASNPELKRRAGDAYRKRNRDRINERSRAYRARYPERVRARNQNYYKTNCTKVVEYVRRRELRKANAPGSHSLAEWEMLKKCFDYTCLRCGKREPEVTLTCDHVIPLAKGGSDNIDNIQPLCKPCNSAKNAYAIDYRPL